MRVQCFAGVDVHPGLHHWTCTHPWALSISPVYRHVFTVRAAAQLAGLCPRALQGCLTSIVHHGFDVRASNSGALGCGVYFGTTSSTSAGYCAATGPQRVAPGAAIPPVPPARPRPGFLPGASAMLLCQVALGRAAPGSGGLRTAPQDYQSCMAGGMYTVYHSDQAYPTRVVHFK